MKLKAKQEEEHAAASNGGHRARAQHENAQLQDDADGSPDRTIDDDQAETDIWAPRRSQEPEVLHLLCQETLSRNYLTDNRRSYVATTLS